jgi:hypothetical protein
VQSPVRELRQLSLDDLEAVSGGSGNICIGVEIRSFCVGINIFWGW